MAYALGPDILPPDLQQQLSSELRSGEKLVWSARPRPGSELAQIIVTVIFGACFAGFAVFWMAAPYLFMHGSGSRGDGPPVVFTLFGVPFVLVGLGLMTSPLWSRKSAARTVFAITNERAIILQPRVFGSWTVQTFMPERLTGMTRTEKADGSGDLIFEHFTERMGTGSRTVRRGFFRIERARDVEDLIVRTLLADRVRR